MARKKTDPDICDVPERLSEHSTYGSQLYGLQLDSGQQAFRDAIWNKDKKIIFCNARAGTGKTLIATATSDFLYKHGKCDGIVYIASPTQEQKQGYLKGTIEEKSEPYFEPFYEALAKIGVKRSTAFYDGGINEKYQRAYIECCTHTFLRGVNFEKKSVIIDEAQNYYFDELKKVLTRLHDSCKVIVIGHEGQNDLFDHPERSGFLPYLRWFAGDDRTAVCHLEENHRGWLSSHADQLTFSMAMKSFNMEDQ